MFISKRKMKLFLTALLALTLLFAVTNCGEENPTTPKKTEDKKDKDDSTGDGGTGDDGTGDGETEDFTPESDFTWTESGGVVEITGYTGAGGAVNIPPTIDGFPVTTIGDEAFCCCASLTSVTIPDSVTTIGDEAFSETSLTSVTIPDSVTIIGYDAFCCCSSLTSVTIPDSVTSIDDWAFSETSLTSVTIPNSVTSIGYEAFCCCSSLTSVTIGNSVTSIGTGAFDHCSSLTSVTVEATTPPTLGNWVFDDNDPSFKIYVPVGYVTPYQTAWSDYSTDIVEQ